MDASTISAIAALVIAIIAMFIATAQATQQYFITGQGIRLCDSVVFADMPGQGRRIWQASQFRFRVVYSIPQISLPNNFWPSNWSVSHKDRRHSLPFLTNRNSRVSPQPQPLFDSPREHVIVVEPRWELGRESQADTDSERIERAWSEKASYSLRRLFSSMRWKVRIWLHDCLRRRLKFNRQPETQKGVGLRTGEAAWVSFCKIIYYSCHEDIRYDLVKRDVDRCPSDLPTVPMPVSLRDVVAMALSVGMHCTEASFTARTLSMQGSAGILATSQHPVLGPLLHFTPGDTSVLHGVVRTGHISTDWLSRTWDWCIVAGESFQHRDRRNVEKTSGVWVHRVRSSGAKSQDVVLGDKDGDKNKRRWAAVKEDDSSLVPATLPSIQKTLGERKGLHDGQWELIFDGPPRVFFQSPPATVIPSRVPASASVSSDNNSNEPASEQNKPGPSLSKPSRHGTFQSTVEDASDNSEIHLPMETSDTPSAVPFLLANSPTAPQIGGPTSEANLKARQRQAERNERAAKIARDEETANNLEKTGRTQTVSGVRLIEWRKEAAEGSSGPQKAAEKIKAETLTEEEQEALDREAQRKKDREARDQQRRLRNNERGQAAYLYGKINWFWLCQSDIMPGFWATPWRSLDALDDRTCSGAVKIVLNALLGFTNGNSLRYVTDWRGFINPAMDWMLNGKTTFPGYAYNARDGVYPAVKIDVFKEPIPALELYSSYNYQVARRRRFDTQTCQNELLELMKLDAWLSMCGRTDEILHGRNDLIKQTPAMVELLFEEFTLDFLNLDQADTEGGMQENQELATNVMDFLLDEELSGAEQMYILVATLRAAKVGLSILEGADTRLLQDILREDVQVHMV